MVVDMLQEWSLVLFVVPVTISQSVYIALKL